MSMDCQTIYVSKSSDEESPPPSAYDVKRHSSMGDESEIYRQNPNFQLRLTDAQSKIFFHLIWGWNVFKHFLP